LLSFAVSWRITQSQKSQNAMAYVSLLVFIVVTFIGLRALFAFV
ncbi:succinate dehydrogenase, partial [Staphylococcus aureus]